MTWPPTRDGVFGPAKAIHPTSPDRACCVLCRVRGEYSLLEVRGARAEREDLERRLAEVERVNDSLRAWGDALEADSATIERVARERYGMIREGEVLYRITPPPDSADNLEAR